MIGLIVVDVIQTLALVVLAGAVVINSTTIGVINKTIRLITDWAEVIDRKV